MCLDGPSYLQQESSLSGCLSVSYKAVDGGIHLPLLRFLFRYRGPLTLNEGSPGMYFLTSEMEQLLTAF